MNQILAKDLVHIYNKLSDQEKEKLQNSTILITGCAGFLGYYFMQFLTRYKQEFGIKQIIGLDNFIFGKPRWIDELSNSNKVNLYKFDIINDKIENIENTGKVSMVIHMASIASPVFYRKYPVQTLEANAWGLRNLLEFYKDKKLKGLLFFSSSEIYGDPDINNIPTDEEFRGYTSCTGPRACYDEAKRFGETMCTLYSKQYNLPVGVARPFNNYGPGMSIDDKRVVADFAKSAYQGRNIEVFSDGTPTRTFSYVADAITGYLKILLYGQYDYFNIGIDNPEISINELAVIYKKKAKEIFNNDIEIIYKKHADKDYLTDNPNRRCPKIDKAKKILNYNPDILIEEGVERFMIFLKEGGSNII